MRLTRTSSLLGLGLIAAMAAACGGEKPAATQTVDTTRLPATAHISSDDPCVLNGVKVQGTITVVQSGGTVSDTAKQAWFTPYEKLCGVKIVVNSPQNLTKIREMVAAKNVTWDLTNDGDPTDSVIGVKEKLFQPMPKGLFDGLHMAPGSINDYGVWSSPYATVIAFSKKAFPDGKAQPQTAADFFDVQNFPGRRCMSRQAIDALELAMVANGYDFKTKPYTIDIPASLGKLNQIKPQVKLWWEQGNQPIDALLNGECTISQAWNGRIFSANKGGANIGLSYSASLLRPTYYHIITNAPNPWGAAALLRFMMMPQPQAAYAELIGYAGGNLDAQAYMTPVTRAALVTAPDNLSQLKGVSDLAGWWAQNKKDTQRQFDAWLTG
jgi:putative spermidine/putrescine transport system substrate-binding protein